MLKLVLLVASVSICLCEQETRYLEKTSGSSRIIHGQDAVSGEFPHQAALLRDGYHTCGASIIHPEYALTAAHCVEGVASTSLAIVVDLHDYQNAGNYIWFDLVSVTMHPSYNKGSGAYPNDVAVLRLKIENQPSIEKNVIQVASGPDTFDHQTCVISGWGRLVSDSSASVLQKAYVTVLNHTHCSQYWSTNVLTQHICIMGTDTANSIGACNGDSGGPLVCSGLLAGAASWVRSGCHVDGVVTHPSAYARTSYFYDWINASCNYCLS